MNKNRITSRKASIIFATICMILLTTVVGAIANYTRMATNGDNTKALGQQQLGHGDMTLRTASSIRDSSTVKFKPDELLIKFKPNKPETVNNTIAKLQATILRYFPIIDVYLIRLPTNLQVETALISLRENAGVEYAEPDYTGEVETTVPNDPYFTYQWSLRNIGQTGGTPDADIDAPEAWDIKTGNKTTVIAVIDTGVDYTHEDLAADMWTSPGEIAGNGLDDDGNGYVDDVYGIDTYNHDSDPLDDFGHGTHCAGIIGAVGNNSIGVAGVNWNASIMALKWIGADGAGYTDGAIECIEYATMMKTVYGINIRVLSNSWHIFGYSQALYDSIEAASSHGILFVVAAANDAKDNDAMPDYPSCYDLDNIISVAATDHNDYLASFSNWGKMSVDVGAPGVDVLSTMPSYHVTMNDMGYTMYYSYMSGTSMACPHVSGLAALILALQASYTYDQVKTRILSTVDELSSLASKILTDGRINAWHALTANNTLMYVNLIQPPEGFHYIKGLSHNITAWVHTATDPILGASVQASFSSGEPSVILKDDGIAPDRTINDGVYTGAWAPLVAGSITVNVSASAGGFPDANASASGYVKSLPVYSISETTYDWIELSEEGLGYCLGDENYGEPLTLALPFAISFYGDCYSNLSICSNGVVNFEDKWLGWENAPIPSSNLYGVQKLVAVCWDDVNMRTTIGNGVVFIGIIGTSPNRTLVIEWKDVAHYYDQGNATFEMLFYENREDIIFQYQDVVFENPYYDFGNTAAVGIQYDQNWGTQYSYFSPSLADGLALRLYVSRENSLGALASKILQDPMQSVYYVRTGNIYDDSALGFVYGKSMHSQNIISQLNPAYINQSTGEPKFPEDLVIFGGRLANKVTKYYEDQSIAKIKGDQNATHVMFKRVDTGGVVLAVPLSTYNPAVKDYFVIQAFNSSGRIVLALWGLSAQGTYASGLCFSDIIWPNAIGFLDAYYIYCWEDLNGDGIQTANEMSLQLSGN